MKGAPSVDGVAGALEDLLRRDRERVVSAAEDAAGEMDASAPVTAPADSTLSAAASPEPVVAEDARRGSVSYVRVESWKPGAAAAVARGGAEREIDAAEADEELGSLRVQSWEKEDHSLPLYDRLARRLQALDKQGLLGVARGRKDRAGKRQIRPPPSPDRWRITEERYLKYLANMFQVHAALEQAVDSVHRAAAATGDTATGRYGGGGGGGTADEGGYSDEGAVETASRRVVRLSEALRLITCDGLLYRSGEIKKDIARLLRARGGGGGGADDVRSTGIGIERAPPCLTADALQCDTQSMSYAQYLLVLAKLATAATERSDGVHERNGGEGSSAGLGIEVVIERKKKSHVTNGGVRANGIPSKGEHASWSLIANCYSLYVSHLASGTQIALKVRK